MKGYITTKDVRKSYFDGAHSGDYFAYKGTIYIPEALIIMPTDAMPRLCDMIELHTIGLLNIQFERRYFSARENIPDYLARIEVSREDIKKQVQKEYLKMAGSKLESLLRQDGANHENKEVMKLF